MLSKVGVVSTPDALELEQAERAIASKMMTGSQILAGQRMSFLPSQSLVEARASDPDAAGGS